MILMIFCVLNPEKNLTSTACIFSHLTCIL